MPAYTLEEAYALMEAFIRRRVNGGADLETEDIQDALDEVGTFIRNYIALNHIPVGPVYGRPGELFYVWAGMAVDVIRFWLAQAPPDGDGDQEIDPRDVQTVKLGDTEVKRGVSASDTVAGRLSTMHSPNLDDLAYNYQHSLNQYRKMRWKPIG